MLLNIIFSQDTWGYLILAYLQLLSVEVNFFSMPIRTDGIYNYTYLVLKFACACYFETHYWSCEVSVLMTQRHMNGDSQHTVTKA